LETDLQTPWKNPDAHHQKNHKKAVFVCKYINLYLSQNLRRQKICAKFTRVLTKEQKTCAGPKL